MPSSDQCAKSSGRPVQRDVRAPVARTDFGTAATVGKEVKNPSILGGLEHGWIMTFHNIWEEFINPN